MFLHLLNTVLSLGDHFVLQFFSSSVDVGDPSSRNSCNHKKYRFLDISPVCSIKKRIFNGKHNNNSFLT